MRTILNQFGQLKNLVSSSNLMATGTNPGYVKQLCEPIADFCIDRTSVCEGATLKFTDRSYNGKNTGRNWSLPGGTPASSSDSVANITYNTAGVYDVELTSANSSGTNSKKAEAVVFVDKVEANYKHFFYREEFENEEQFDSLFLIEPSGNKVWKLSQDAAISGVYSAKFLNYVNSETGYITNMITPSYDLTKVFLPRLTFELAYARKSSNSEDQLRIHYSNSYCRCL